MAFRTGVRLPSPPRNMHACEYGSFPVLLSPATSGVAKYWRMKVDRGHASSLRPAAGRTALQHGVDCEYVHGCGRLARRQGTSILFPCRATTPEGIQGMACGPETHVVTVSPTFSFQSLSEIWLQREAAYRPRERKAVRAR